MVSISTDTPLVSIVAVCFNQEAYVEETLNSILSQQYNNIQLIIADDGSTDGSKDRIRHWIDSQAPATLFINHPKNVGLTRNINSAIPFIKGAYYQVFGCDDIMLPNKIKDQVALLEANKDVGVVYSDMLLIDEHGESLHTTYFEKHRYKRPGSGHLYQALIDRFMISAPTVLISRAVLDYCKSYNTSLDYEDHDFFLRAAKKFSFLYVPEVTVNYRRNLSSLTSTKTEIRFFKNSFLIYLQRFDKDKDIRPLFVNKLLFYTKSLYSQQYVKCSVYFFRAFLKTRAFIFLKYSAASLRFYFNGTSV